MERFVAAPGGGGRATVRVPKEFVRTGVVEPIEPLRASCGEGGRFDTATCRIWGGVSRRGTVPFCPLEAGVWSALGRPVTEERGGRAPGGLGDSDLGDDEGPATARTGPGDEGTRK